MWSCVEKIFKNLRNLNWYAINVCKQRIFIIFVILFFSTSILIVYWIPCQVSSIIHWNQILKLWLTSLWFPFSKRTFVHHILVVGINDCNTKAGEARIPVLVAFPISSGFCSNSQSHKNWFRSAILQRFSILIFAVRFAQLNGYWHQYLKSKLLTKWDLAGHSSSFTR